MGLQDKTSRENSNSWMTSLHKSNDANKNRLSSFHISGSNKFGIFATPAPDTNKQKLSLAALRARVEEQNKNKDAPQLENCVSPEPTIINAVQVTLRLAPENLSVQTQSC